MNVNMCGSLFGLILFGLSFVKTDTKSRPKRYNDKSFPRENMILGRNVTCGDLPLKEVGKFVSHTWTCKNIRVNGFRIAYGYYKGMGVDTKCIETGGKHEFPQLCREMLKKVDVERPLHALYVPKASCGYVREKRAILNRTSEEVFTWLDMGPGNGWIDTLQCMITHPKMT